MNTNGRLIGLGEVAFAWREPGVVCRAGDVIQLAPLLMQDLRRASRRPTSILFAARRKHARGVDHDVATASPQELRAGRGRAISALHGNIS